MKTSLVDFHQIMLNRIVVITDKIINSVPTEGDSIDETLGLLDKREIMVSILKHLEDKIDLQQENVERVKFSQWKQSTILVFEELQRKDDIIIQLLEKMKLEIKTQISSNFTNSNSIKGYNLNCVR